MKPSRPGWIWIPYLVFLVVTNAPVLHWVNRIEPRIGPFPFFIGWMLFWSLSIGVFHLVWMLRTPTPLELAEDLPSRRE